MEDTSKLKTFPFNERPAMKINVPGDADPIFFFGLMLTDDLVEDSVQKRTRMYTKPLIEIDHFAADLRETLGQMSLLIK